MLLTTSRENSGEFSREVVRLALIAIVLAPRKE
jgi:hypothetical protein